MNRTLINVAIFVFVVIFLIVEAVAGASGETSIAVPVHLADAADMAVKSRPELRMELEREDIARSKVKEARGNFLPTLDLLASSYYVRNFDTFTGIDISAQIAGQNVSVNIEKDVPRYQMNAELNLCYNLYAGGRDKALLGEALSNLESAHYQEGVTLRKIRLDVANAYWELKKVQIRYEIAKRALEVVRLETKVAETEHQAGRASDVEYATVQLKSREKEMALKAADRDCLRAYGSFRHVIGMHEDGMATSSEQIPVLLDEPSDENEGIGGQVDHPEILRLKSEIKAAREREKAAHSENYPKIDVFAKYSLIGRDSNAYFNSWGDTRSDNYMVGLKLTANLFNGFRTTEQIRQADTESRVKQLQLIQKEMELTEAKHVRKSDLETANDGLFLAMERKKLEETREKVARAQLQSGRISELEYRQMVADAEEAVDRVELARIEVAMASNALKLLVLE